MRCYIIFFLVFSGCLERKNEKENLKFTYSIDTVKIDSKNEILDIWGFLSFSHLDSGRESIFGYNSFSHSLDQIDLNKLEFSRRQKLEKEGPNGTGDFYQFNILGDDRFFIKSFDRSALFDRMGSLLQEIDWRNSISSNGEKYNDFPGRQILVDSDELLAFGLSYDYESIDVNLDIFQVGENSTERLDLSSQESYRDLSMRSKRSGNIIDPSIEFIHENDKIIISYEFSSQIVVYDYKAKTLRFVDYDPKWTPKRVRKPNIKEGSLEEIVEEIKLFREQVTFYRPVWDLENKRFYRLSTKTIYAADKPNNSESRYGEIEDTKVYLTVFDQEFNVISELKIEELSDFDNDYFAKDGKLWLCINLDDELGFVRLGLSESN